MIITLKGLQQTVLGVLQNKKTSQEQQVSVDLGSAWESQVTLVGWEASWGKNRIHEIIALLNHASGRSEGNSPLQIVFSSYEDFASSSCFALHSIFLPYSLHLLRKNFIRSNPKVITYPSAIFQQTRQNYSKSKNQIILLYICLWTDEPGQIHSGRCKDGMVANKYAVLPNIKLSPDALL